MENSKGKGKEGQTRGERAQAEGENGMLRAGNNGKQEGKIETGKMTRKERQEEI